MAQATGATPDLGRPQSQARAWFEPLLVVTIMVTSLIVNRDRKFSLFSNRNEPANEALMKSEDIDDSSRGSSRSASPNGPKNSLDLQRLISGSGIEVSRMNFPSRILQKFPFLVEMFYWALNFIAYSMTKKIGAALYSRYGGDAVTQLAQDHGIAILNFEHNSPASIFFPVSEVEFQQFLLTKHLSIMTIFNQIYSLVHIPGTVAYLSWYYYKAPSYDAFAVARRTMTLGNFSAFFIFSFYPCMPPRLLPESFGFKDTVRQEHAESVWVGGSNVNQLAAMPSLHFTYAFTIGCTFLYTSGLLQSWRGRRSGRSPFSSFVYVVAGIFYPLLVLSVIVATANHYYLDAVVATFSVAMSFLCNRIWLFLLPVEASLLRMLRLRKPRPSTRRIKAERPSAATSSSLEVA
ncbi:integral membrane protein [Zymoseptoria brevis]|uniref:Integral membrane protein n=1 Tax=Zymoseptoria brevis TaxID=1047168 RepID=A0A0F4GME3_9PEZI|nr:integral membrane protein [Zymoseptoria brevis]